jgi:dolichyl-diphosphooligosaccharide--protein glycosyltransferase
MRLSSNQKKNILFLAGVLAVFAFGVALRLIPWENFITRDGVYLLEGDNYEHLRKVTIVLNGFPWFPSYDYYMGYPVGTGNITNPFFDLVLAFSVRLALVFYDGLYAIEKLLVVLPPFLGMLSVFPFFLWARETFGPGRALVATAVFVLMPAHIYTTMAGRPDNELAEPFAAAVLFYLYALSLRKLSGEGRRAYLIPALTGIMAFVSILFWRGALLWWAIIGCHIFFIMLSGRKVEWRALWRSGTVIFVAAAAATLVYCLLDPFNVKPGFNFNTVSWFHLIAALLMAAGLWATARFLGAREKGRPFWRAILSGASVLAGAIVLSVVAAPGFFSGIFEGSQVVGGANVWTKTIAQYRPLLTDDAGRFSLSSPLRASTAFLFLAPVVLMALSLPKRLRGSAPAYSFFVFSGWVLFLLSLVNGRYENVFTLTVAACGGLFLVAVYNFLRERLGLTAGRLAGGFAAIAAAIVLLYPSAPFYKGLTMSQPFLIKGDLEETLYWIKSATPPTSHFLEPWKKPEYGVMARWEFGGWIEHIAQRPSVASVYGMETHGLAESAAFFLATDEKEFLEIIDRNNVRYFILSKTLGALPEYAGILGRDPSGYLVTKPDESGRPVWETGDKFFRLAQTGLYMMDGQAADSPIPFKEVGGVRLVYESLSASDVRGFAGEVKQYKVFERVKGARLIGRARPGEKIILAGTVVTNQGREFQTVRSTVADATGRFVIEAWYPTVRPGEYKTGVKGAYILKIGNSGKGLLLSEEDVMNGAVLELGG